MYTRNSPLTSATEQELMDELLSRFDTTRVQDCVTHASALDMYNFVEGFAMDPETHSPCVKE